jgi:hypothetical protein
MLKSNRLPIVDTKPAPKVTPFKVAKSYNFRKSLPMGQGISHYLIPPAKYLT